MRIIHSLLAVALVAGCASEPQYYQSAATPAQKDSAVRALDACATRNLQMLDDYISPAPIIAKVLVGLCADEARQLAHVQNAGFPPAWEAPLFDKIMTGAPLQGIVLIERSRARQSGR